MMGSQERSRKGVHTWKKAILHFLLCFVVGFFTGFTPNTKPWRSSPSSHVKRGLPSPFSTSHSPHPVEFLHDSKQSSQRPAVLAEESMKNEWFDQEKLVIIVSPTSRRNKARSVLLNRLANTLRLVARPLLWVVVEQKSHDSKVSEILRKTGIMYRHIIFDEDFKDEVSEIDHQRNLALNHIEHHRLSGVVHFAGLSNVYDLTFFQEIRAIEAFGAWPIARMGANKKRVKIEGPVCESSEVIGWHFKKMKNNPTLEIAAPSPPPSPPIHISSFAFNSSILWDPERWGRTFSTQDASQNSVKYVEKEILEEEAKLKGLPMQGCSKVLLWDLTINVEHK